jgi:mevalonate kinase
MNSSFGKVILSGEHSAVYDQPAVAASLDLQIEAKLNIGALPEKNPFTQNLLSLFEKKFAQKIENFSIEFTGNLPMGSGLGSSAAAAHSALQALAQHFNLPISDDQKIEFIQESERFAHGHPSGLDAVTVVKKGVIEFQRSGADFRFAQLPSQQIQETPFSLIQSGQPTESTKRMIEIVKEKQQTDAGKQAIAAIGKITTQLIVDIKANAFILDWMPENERYLEEIGAVSPKAREMIRQIENEKGFAKITGAGGATEGAGMILAYHSDAEKLHAFLAKKEWQHVQVQLGNR